MLSNAQIDIRDTYILPHDGKYYMYGTCGFDAFSGTAGGFRCYVGNDLEHWDGPYCVFPNDGTSWATSNYWAPEVYEIDGKFYMFASWTSAPTEGGIRSPQTICVLRADDPLGPFRIHNDRLCPGNDPTLYEKDGRYYLVYTDCKVTMLAAEMTADLSGFAGESVSLFSRTDPGVSWSVGGPTEGAETFVTKTGKLLVLWSSFCKGHSKKFAALGLKDMDYGTSIAYAPSGNIYGPYQHEDVMLTPPNMGHCNLFYGLDDQLMLATHYPDDDENEFGCSNPLFVKVDYREDIDSLRIDPKEWAKLEEDA